MSKELIEKLVEIDKEAFRVIQDDVGPYGATLNCGWLRERLAQAIDLVRQHTDWQDEPAEEVSVTAIAVKASGGEKAWDRLNAAQRQERLENARDVIAAMGFVPRHDYWQPIATAPKADEILGFGSYLYPGDRNPTIYYAIIEWDEDAWSSWEGKHADVFFSHWMPLPPKPE